MRLPFSSKDLRRLINNDPGFQQFLKALPLEFTENLTNKILDDSHLNNIFQLLPPASRDYVISVFENVINMPEKARTLYEQCRYFEARELLLSSIELYKNPPQTPHGFLNKSVGFVTKRAQALFNDLLADIESVLGNTQEAMTYHQRALQLAKDINDLNTTVKAKNSIGAYYLQLGEIEKCLKYCHDALETISGHTDQWSIQNKILSTLAEAYNDLGQIDRAYEYALQSIDLSIQRNDRKLIPVNLNNLACLYLEHGDINKAIETLKYGLMITQEDNDLLKEALILNNLAVCYLREPFIDNNLELAKSYIESADVKSRKIGSMRLKALSANNLGKYFQIIGKRIQAKEAYLKAVTIYRQTGLAADEAASLCNLGSLFKRELSDLDGATESFDKAIKILEKIRGNLRKEVDRITYTDVVSDPYEQIIDCLVPLNRIDEAVEYAERAKSRSLLDFLTMRIEEGGFVAADRKMFAKALSRLKEIDELRESIRSINKKSEDKTTNDKARKNVSEYEQLTQSYSEMICEKEREFTDIYREINTTDPENASLIKVQAISVAEIQNCIGPNAAFIEFYQTEEQLHVFTVAANEPVKHVQIPTKGTKSFDQVQNVLEKIKQKDFLDVRSHEFIKEIREPLIHFFDLIFEPLLPYIQKSSHIIISPHLFWHYFPFHALYNKKRKQYLCDQFEISFCPSASVLRRCTEKNYTNRDSGLILARNNEDLIHVEQEAKTIESVFNPDADIFLSTDADLEKIESTHKSYDIIHLACHGRFDFDQPFLSGVHLPSSNSDTHMAYLLDFFKLNIQTNLVTLSACESGLVHYTSGDEMLGISRGLFYAGAASVLLSLWQVADESTCYLMENFYWHYVKNRKTKSRALQLAMQAVKAKKEYSHPYFWAPFVVIGDWR